MDAVCLERLKKNYEKLYEQYINTADKLTSVTKTFIRLLNNVTIVINPAIYGNKWTAWYYRQWFFRDLREILDIWAILTESSSSHFVLSALQHSSKNLGLNEDAETFKSWKTIVEKFDPSNKYIGWWTSEAAVDSIQRLRTLLSYLQVRISEWYELSYWRNKGDLEHKEEFEKLYSDVHEAFELIEPKDLFVCQGEHEEEDDSDKEIQRLKDRLDQVNNEKAQLEVRLLAVQNELRICTESKKDDSSADKILALQAQLDAANQEIDNLRESEQKKSQRLVAFENRNAELEAKFIAITAELEGIKGQLLFKNLECDEHKKQLQDSEKACQEQVKELKNKNKDLEDKLAKCLADKKVMEAPKDNADQLELIRDLQQQLVVCQNNLTRVNQEYRELEEENNKNKDLVVLYREEANKFRNFYTDNPIQAENASERQKREGAIGVGKNFDFLFKNSESLRYSIAAIVTDYKNRTRSIAQNISNVGWYWNYLIDDTIQLLKPYLGEAEINYINKRRIPAAFLSNIYQ